MLDFFITFTNMNFLRQSGQILRMSIGVAYVILGLILIFLKINLFGLPTKTKIIFSVLLIAYGLFRMYRAIKFKNEEY